MSFPPPPSLDSFHENEKKKWSTILSSTPHELKWAPESIKKDKSIVLIALKKNGNTLEFVDQNLKNENLNGDEIINTALKNNPLALKYTDPKSKYRHDSQLVLNLLEKNGNCLEFVNDKFKKDLTFINVALKSTSSSFKFIDDSFKKNKDFIWNFFKSLKSLNIWEKYNIEKGQLVKISNSNIRVNLFSFVDSSLKNDKEFVEKVVLFDPSAFLHSNLRNDSKFVRMLLSKNHYVFEYCTEEFRNDKELAWSVILKDPCLVQYIGKKLFCDKQFVLDYLTKIQNSSLGYIKVLVENFSMYYEYGIYGDFHFILQVLEQNSSVEKFVDIMKYSNILEKKIFMEKIYEKYPTFRNFSSGI